MSASNSPRIVILGGGFSGVFSARYLRRAMPKASIELVSERNYFVFQPLLPEVAAGIINIQDAVAPLRLLLPRVQIRLAQATHINFAEKYMTVLQGRKQVPIDVAYDHLVIASGLISDLDRFPGFASHTLSMKYISDAYALRNRVVNCLEHADITKDPEIKKALMHFVVIGGGFSGVETMGEVAEMLRRTISFYKNIPPNMLKMTLVQRGSRILPELPESLAKYAHNKLRKRGIEVLCNTGMKQAVHNGVVLSDDRFLPSATVVTTIGNGPSKFIQQLDVPMHRGRIVTDSYLRITKYPGVWGLGDVAAVPMQNSRKQQAAGEKTQYAPPTAQFAVQEAKFIARNIAKTCKHTDKGKQVELHAFNYKPKGSMASIGNYRAVADVMGVKMSGIFAWFVWRGFYMIMLPGMVTRLRVSLNWLLDYFVPRNIVQVEQARTHACRYIHVRAGAVLFRPNEIVQGLYTVISGRMESRVHANNHSTQDDKDYVRVLNAGDHWGERVIDSKRNTIGQLKALEDSVLMLTERETFSRLRDGLPAMREYFDSVAEENYPPELRQRTRDNA